MRKISPVNNPCMHLYWLVPTHKKIADSALPDTTPEVEKKVDRLPRRRPVLPPARTTAVSMPTLRRITGDPSTMPLSFYLRTHWQGTDTQLSRIRKKENIDRRKTDNAWHRKKRIYPSAQTRYWSQRHGPHNAEMRAWRYKINGPKSGCWRILEQLDVD
jgi:hypothetical protein